MSKTTLTQANAEWASRPQDERFSNLTDLHAACVKRQRACTDGTLPMDEMRLSVNGNVLLTSIRGTSAKLTHWALGQLCTRLGVPRDLLPKLDPEVASAVLNDRLPKSIAEGDVKGRQRVLLHSDDDGQRTLRAFHGDVYNRVWDAQVTGTLMEYLPKGWRNPVAYKNGKFGADLEPSGLYTGDRSMFAFFIDGGDWTTYERGTFDVDGEAFNRGFFAWNSEVGSDTLGFMPFVFDVVCGNHYVWGARNVEKFKARHVGRGATRMLYAFRAYLNELNETTGAPEGFAAAVRAAKSVIASPVRKGPQARTEVLEDAFESFKGKFTKAQIVLALDAMLREEKNVTGTRYDWLAGFTAVAREYKNADERVALETQASKLLLAPAHVR